MILPEGNNSKYIKMVIGVFVLFTIISPIINKITGKNNSLNLFSNIKNYEEKAVTASANLDNEKLIKQMYEENLKIDIKAKISQKGYVIGNLSVEILNDNEYTLNSINMKIIGNSNTKNNNNQNTTTIVENVENILINVGGKSDNKNDNEKSVISESEKRKLIQYLSSVYEVKENNIHIY